MNGLNSTDAIELLTSEIRHILDGWHGVNVVNIPKLRVSHDRRYPEFYCQWILNAIRLSLIFLCIGAVDMWVWLIRCFFAIPSPKFENEVDFYLISLYVVIFIFTFVLQYWQNQVIRANHKFLYDKAQGIVDEIEKLSSNGIQYPVIYDAIMENMPLQLTRRDGNNCQVPRLLLVTRDVIMLRPGQKAPCDCELSDGRELKQGEKLDREMSICEETDAIEPLELVPARVMASPIRYHLDAIFTEHVNPLQFEVLLYDVVHRIVERFLIPLFFIACLLITPYRFFYSDSQSLFHTRFAFAVPFMIVFPLFCPLYPVLMYLIRIINNRQICNTFGVVGQMPKDLVTVLAALTTVAVIDKKGVLSLPEPSIRKMMFFKSKENEDDDSTSSEILNLSSIQISDDEWELDFDEPTWATHMPNLLPMAYNMMLNSCAHNGDFARFLDHLSVVADSVPRTIATANRRCMCQLPIRIGFLPSTGISQIPSTFRTGIYARQPGDAPMPGVVKHRTPLEMAFCTVQIDDHSLHSHLSSQGTAKLILDACSHFWSGQKVIPLTLKERRIAIDFHRRHSMTGHCLALAYRPVFGNIEPTLAGKYIEMPLLGTMAGVELGGHLARSQSIDDLLNSDGLRQNRIVSNSHEFINDVFSGQILCGLVALQYEAMPWASRLVDSLNATCVRPVFFSKENELRSRVFAEKLGLEAGWNCHITLAEEDEEKIANKRKISAMEMFSSVAKRKFAKLHGRFARSDALLANLDIESFSRNSPTRRPSLLSSDDDKVAPIPNVARLPIGIDEVRPHLEAVDNVPLLVGLFTDCNMQSTLEMIIIMQDYKEVVACIGSSLNSFNTPIYRKAHLSISIDPLQCSSCKHERVALTASPKAGLSAISVASRLAQMATDLHLSQEQCLKLPAIISSARHRMASVRSSLLFMLYSSILLSLTIICSAIFILPIIFTESQVLLTVFLQIPLLTMGTIFTSFTPKHSAIRIAQKNSIEFPNSEYRSSSISFLIQFAPTAFFLNALFWLLLVKNGNAGCENSEFMCWLNMDDDNSVNRTNPLLPGDYSFSVGYLRHVIGFEFLVCLIILSSCFVFPLSSFWTDPPIFCWTWIGSVVTSLISQVIFSYARHVPLHKVFDIPSTLALIIWVVILILINELLKLRRIGQFARDQRRTKLGFDTKLGMNSPY